MISTCHMCNSLFDASSTDEADDPTRVCSRCYANMDKDRLLLRSFQSNFETASIIFEEKNRVRGSRNIAESGFPGVTIRLQDKLARLKNATSTVTCEDSIEDTLYDIMNYANIALLLYRGQWPWTDEQSVASSTPSLEVLVLEDGASGISAPLIAGDVGFDLRASADCIVPVMGHGITNIPTGVKIKAPPNTWFRIVGRSSAKKRGLIVPDSVIDCGYTGEILVNAYNITDSPIDIKQGERLAQVVFCPAVVPSVTVVKSLPATARGAAGWGSTGETIGGNGAHDVAITTSPHDVTSKR